MRIYHKFHFFYITNFRRLHEKINYVLVAGITAFSFTACGGSANAAPPSEAPEAQQEAAVFENSEPELPEQQVSTIVEGVEDGIKMQVTFIDGETYYGALFSQVPQ